MMCINMLEPRTVLREVGPSLQITALKSVNVFLVSPDLAYFNIQVNKTLFLKYFIIKIILLHKNTVKIAQSKAIGLKSYFKSHFFESTYILGQPRSEPHEILTLLVKLVLH